jgi:hypothetical protein
MAIGRIPEPGTGIPESIIAAKGDILTGTANDTPAVLSVGTNGHTLVADSSTATGLAWAAPAAGSFVGCLVTAPSPNQSTSNTVQTKVNFNTEDYDTDGFHDNSVNNSRITIPSGKGGYYFVYGFVSFDANTTGRRIVYLTKNNATLIQNNGFSVATNTQYPALDIGIALNLAAGDYLELEAYQSSGGSLNLNNDSTTMKFGVYKIG